MLTRRRLLAQSRNVVAATGWLCLAMVHSAIAQESPVTSKPAAPQVQTAPQANATGTSAQSQAEPPIPAILQPYQVEVRISLPRHPRFSGGFGTELIEQVQREIESRFRRMWTFTVEVPADSRRFAHSQIRSLQTSDVQESFLTRKVDKIFLVGVELSGSLQTVVTREWDANSRTLSPVNSDTIADPRELVSAIVSGLAATFRPLAMAEVLEEGRIDFQVRAGELFPADPGLSQFQPGDFLVLYMRHLDRSREVRQIQLYPWTYLKVASIDRSRIRVEFISAFRFPFSGSRRRVEVMAIRARSEFPTTKLKVFPYRNPLNPLVGYRCEILDRVPTEADPVPERIKLLTDRQGIITIPVDPKSPQKFLMIYSGEALLARVPILVGVEPNMELEVPDDRARLNVEGEVDLLQGELIDIVATREVIMARTRAAAEKKDWQKVDEFLTELEQLPTQNVFLGRIDSLQVQAVYRAQQLKDRVQEQRVKILCNSIMEAAKLHLDPARIIDFRQEMRENRNS